MKKWFGLLKCLFGFHLPGEYGGVKIISIDRDKHHIEYANIKRCPRCKVQVQLDFSH